MALRRVLDGLTARAIRERLGGRSRALQERLDTARVLAALRGEPPAAGSALGAADDGDAAHEARLLETRQRLRAAVLSLAGHAREALRGADPPAELRRRVGFSVDVAPSGVGEGGGDGLWLRGAAPAGAVVALYPGVAYAAPHHRWMPGFPRVARDNSFLMARYDGVVLDAQPWGRGGAAAREEWGGPHAAEHPGVAAEAAEAVERRNPLALAHWANHPPAGARPNVLSFAFDYPLGEAGGPRDMAPVVEFVPEGEQASGAPDVRGPSLLRRFLGLDDGLTAAERREAGVAGDGPEAGSAGAHEATLPLLVLVAAEPLRDCEVLLNYRLSPGLSRPDWYHPVDEEEEERRWS